MTDAYVQVAVDGAGKKVDTTELTVSSQTVERQRVHIAGSYSSGLAEVFPAGFLRTSDEPRQTFYDPFDSALDTVTRWLPPMSGGGGIEAVASGSLSIGSGVTPGGFSAVESRPAFVPVVPGWLGISFAITIESGVAITNAYRFWGAGSNGAISSTSTPLWDAYGFEIATDGKLYAVVYASGARTAVADLSTSQPTDGLPHRYIVYYRTDRTFWYIDSLASPVATSNFNSPTVQSLPVKFLAIAGTTPAQSAAITCLGLAVWDTGKNSTLLADGTHSWLRATIKAGAKRAEERDTALVVTQHPGSVAAVTSDQLDLIFDEMRKQTRELRRMSYILASVAGLDFAATDFSLEP